MLLNGESTDYFSTQGWARTLSGLSCFWDDVPFVAAAFLALRSKKLAMLDEESRTR
jgi:hypothetical protein